MTMTMTTPNGLDLARDRRPQDQVKDDDLPGAVMMDSLRLRAGGFTFASTPMLLLDQCGRVEEINDALRELTGHDLAGVVGAELDEVWQRLCPRHPGPLPLPVPPRRLEGELESWRPGYDHVRIDEAVFDYETRRFGRARLHAALVPSIDPATGSYLGTTLNFEVRAIGDPARFDEALRRRWQHELMWIIYAVSYDRILPEMPFYREVVGRHLEALRGADARRVLDLGAGTGNVAVPLLDEGRDVVAVDLSRAMITRLWSKVRGADPGRFSVFLQTAERLPRLPDGSFDGVSALLSLFDMDEPQLALAEAVRLLRPGGTIVVTDPKACFDVQPLLAFGERCLRETGRFEELRDDWDRIRSVAPDLDSRIRAKGSARLDDDTAGPWDAEHILRKLRDAGFVGLTFRDSHLGNCATIVGRKPSADEADGKEA